MIYKLCSPHPIFGESKSVMRLTDNSCIPFDELNIDYQEYLMWVAEGNEPLPADE